jgi:hypothetical protein
MVSPFPRAVEVDETWPTLDPAALYGLPGDVVHAIGPHTEADPVAILAQYLVAAGNAIGHGPYYRVEGDRHTANLYAVLVGETAKGRKGTSAGRIRQVMRVADAPWESERVVDGLSTGEGLIWHVRDASVEWVRDGKGVHAPLVERQADPGVSDKRIMILEPEFARALRVMQRDGNTLSSVIRAAWDRGDLSTLTKNSPARATGAHVSLVGHITADELRADLDRVSMANGYANRILWLCVRRARELPFGGALDDERIDDLGQRTAAAIRTARQRDRVQLTADAKESWRRVYPELSEGRPGLLGALTARAEAQTVRLALAYALLDGRGEIGVDHLQAALALWEYADASVQHVWGDALGDPVADEIMRALRQAGPAGLTRTELSNLFARNRDAAEIGRALAMLAAAGKARRITRDTGGTGRPAELWVATGY